VGADSDRRLLDQESPGGTLAPTRRFYVAGRSELVEQALLSPHRPRASAGTGGTGF